MVMNQELVRFFASFCERFICLPPKYKVVMSGLLLVVLSLGWADYDWCGASTSGGVNARLAFCM